MDTFITLTPIVMAIASGLWVSHRRKNKAPWIRTWLKAIAVLVGIPVAAYCIFMALGLTDADVRWLIQPLTFMAVIGISSIAGVAATFAFNLYKVLNDHSNSSGKNNSDIIQADEDSKVSIPTEQNIHLAGYLNETDYILNTGDHSAIWYNDDE